MPATARTSPRWTLYALSLFASGDTAGAIKWQQKAVDSATDDRDRELLEAALKKYQAAAAEIGVGAGRGKRGAVPPKLLCAPQPFVTLPPAINLLL